MYYIFLNDREYCDSFCPKRCEKIQYANEISVSDYPSQSHFNNLKANAVIRKKLDGELITYDLIRRNTLGVRIYFGQLSFTLRTESPKFLFVEMFANVGGLLGN